MSPYLPPSLFDRNKRFFFWFKLNQIYNSKVFLFQFYQSCVKSDVASLTPPENKHIWEKNENNFRHDIAQITQGWPLHKINEELSFWGQLTHYMVDAKSKGYYYELFLELRAETDKQTGEAWVTVCKFSPFLGELLLLLLTGSQLGFNYCVFFQISYPSLDKFRKHDMFWSDHQNVRRILFSINNATAFESYIVPMFRRDLRKVFLH